MIEVSVALREVRVAPHAMVWLIYLWRYSVGGGDYPKNRKKSCDWFFLTLLYLNHSILTFINCEMRLGHLDT